MSQFVPENCACPDQTGTDGDRTDALAFGDLRRRLSPNKPDHDDRKRRRKPCCGDAVDRTDDFLVFENGIRAVEVGVGFRGREFVAFAEIV